MISKDVGSLFTFLYFCIKKSPRLEELENCNQKKSLVNFRVRHVERTKQSKERCRHYATRNLQSVLHFRIAWMCRAWEWRDFWIVSWWKCIKSVAFATGCTETFNTSSLVHVCFNCMWNWLWRGKWKCMKGIFLMSKEKKSTKWKFIDPSEAMFMFMKLTQHWKNVRENREIL